MFCFSNQSVVLLPKAAILSPVTMVGDYNPASFVATGARYILKEILEAFSNYLVGAEIYVILVVDITEPVGERGVTDSADKTNRFRIGDDAEDRASEIVPAVLIPAAHRVVSIIV